MPRRKVQIPLKEDLFNLYAREGETISSLARFYSTSNLTVRSWLDFYGIPRKSQQQASTEANKRNRNRVKPTKEVFKNLYETSSIDALESHFNVGQQTIYNWIADFGLDSKSLSESCKLAKSKQFESIQFTREFLDVEYDRTKSLVHLASKLNVSKSHVRKQLILNNIPIETIEPSYRSKAEIYLYEYLVSEFPTDTWSHSNKTIINPYELDIVNHTKNLAIEYCGLYWHSEYSSGKKQDYHRQKYLACKKQGFKLLTIFESDDLQKVKSLLLKLLGKTSKIGARKTQLKTLTPTEAMTFHQQHHLHNGIGGSHHYGLFYQSNLVMVASFAKNRFSKHYQYECSRLTSHSNYTVVGGVSKLMKHFIETVNPESIITFSDLRFGEGSTYLHCGFKRIEDSAPNYWYTKTYTPKLHSRVKFQKHKLKQMLEQYDPLKTEYENMLEHGWDRLWDCGNAKYEWRH